MVVNFISSSYRAFTVIGRLLNKLRENSCSCGFTFFITRRQWRAEDLQGPRCRVDGLGGVPGLRPLAAETLNLDH
jgi:hypothetical protein